MKATSEDKSIQQRNDTLIQKFIVEMLDDIELTTPTVGRALISDLISWVRIVYIHIEDKIKWSYLGKYEKLLEGTRN